MEGPRDGVPGLARCTACSMKPASVIFVHNFVYVFLVHNFEFVYWFWVE